MLLGLQRLCALLEKKMIKVKISQWVRRCALKSRKFYESVVSLIYEFDLD